MNSAKQAQARNQQLIKSRNGTERLTGKQSNQSNLNQIQNQTELLAERQRQANEFICLIVGNWI